MASTPSNTSDKDFMKIAEAFAAKESSTAEDVIRLISGLKQMGTFAQAAPAPAAAHEQPAPAAEDSARAAEIHEEATNVTSEPAPAPKKRMGRPPKAKAKAETATPTKAKSSTKKAASKKAKAEKAAPVHAEVPLEETAQSTGVEKATEPPAIPMDQAITDDKVYCLECGRGFQMLKRHLGTVHGLTPEMYKERWDLPEDWPITAPNYTASKSKYAKEIGFGKSGTAIAPKHRRGPAAKMGKAKKTA